MFKKISGAFGYCLSSLILAFSAAWLCLAAVNFSYGFWHDHTGIKAAIDKYGALNHFKQGFELTTKAQREALFAQILHAVVSRGEGLADIQFQVAGQPSQALLREPEVIHLQDVAHLIQLSPLLVVPAGLLWLALISFWMWRRLRPTPLLTQVIALLAGVGVVVVTVLAIGPIKVFNQLHIWAFPAGHQWFFYYQESLMSSLMHAPELFGWIAIEWTLLALCWYAVLQVFVIWLLRGRGVRV